MSECPDISRLNENELEWYFCPLLKAEQETSYHDHYRYSLVLDFYGSTLPYIQGPVRERVMQTVFHDLKTFMNHDRALRSQLCTMGRFLHGTMVKRDPDEDFQAFTDWYWDRYNEIFDIRQENYDTVRNAADTALSLPARTDTIH